jgi:hypothetical protein
LARSVTPKPKPNLNNAIVDIAIIKNKRGAPFDIAVRIVVNPLECVRMNVNINFWNDIITKNFSVIRKIRLSQ